jgi:hypothetical protein
MDALNAGFPEVGVGATAELSLRVSVATLCKVLFNHPEDGRTMLVLERTATWREIEAKQQVIVKAKPFGGGVQIKDLEAFQTFIGEFQFDSQRSREEMDFRIHIRPQNWEKVKAFCLRQFQQEIGILESWPERELREEFEDALKIKINQDDYHKTSVGAVVEEEPVKTDNVRAPGTSTVRVYNVFEVRVIATRLVDAILKNSASYSDEDLRSLAWEDVRSGGKGRANGVLALPFDLLTNAYMAIPLNERDGPIRFEGYQLEGNVLAVFEEIPTGKYERIM